MPFERVACRQLPRASPPACGMAPASFLSRSLTTLRG